MTFKGLFTKIKEFIAYSKSRYYFHFDDNIYYEISGYKAKIMNFINIIYSIINFKSRNMIIGERIVEIPFLYKNIDFENTKKILDLGCVGSKTSLQLASIGLSVIAVDYRSYPFKHKNLEFIQGNFFDLEFPLESFDCAYSISTIEHIGLPAYNIKPFEDGDKKAIEKLYQLLKTRGKLILTVPFGKNKVSQFARNYNLNSLKKLLSDFKIDKLKIYEKKKDGWELSDTSPSNLEKVACIVCFKE